MPEENTALGVPHNRGISKRTCPAKMDKSASDVDMRLRTAARSEPSCDTSEFGATCAFPLAGDFWVGATTLLPVLLALWNEAFVLTVSWKFRGLEDCDEASGIRGVSGGEATLPGPDCCPFNVYDELCAVELLLRFAYA